MNILEENQNGPNKTETKIIPKKTQQEK